MGASQKPKLDFIIIGVQKSSTSWLWKMLKQHPEMDLSNRKEIHYFGGIENYRRGDDWYYAHFDNVDSNKINGEASTSYFYDVIPYWHHDEPGIESDPAMPTIPELILDRFPDIKIIILMRDPVRRAISAYQHVMRQRDKRLSPLRSLRMIAKTLPRKRLLEYGRYPRIISHWQKFIPPERMHYMIFEEDVLKTPIESVQQAFEFLGVDPTFTVSNPQERYNSKWTWTRTVLHHYAGPFAPLFKKKRKFGELADKVDILRKFEISQADIDFLRDEFLPEKEELESLIDRSVDCWKYTATPS